MFRYLNVYIIQLRYWKRMIWYPEIRINRSTIGAPSTAGGASSVGGQSTPATGGGAGGVGTDGGGGASRPVTPSGAKSKAGMDVSAIGYDDQALQAELGRLRNDVDNLYDTFYSTMGDIGVG